MTAPPWRPQRHSLVTDEQLGAAVRAVIEAVLQSAAGSTFATAAEPTEPAAKERRLLSIPDAAHYLGVSRRTLEQLISRGEVLKVHIGARAFVDKKDLDRYVDELRRQA